MSRFWRNFLCIWLGIIFGNFGALIVFIFWPLIFPEALQGPTPGEDALPFVVLLFFVTFGVPGLLLSRKLTRKYVRDKDSLTVLFR